MVIEQASGQGTEGRGFQTVNRVETLTVVDAVAQLVAGHTSNTALFEKLMDRLEVRDRIQ